MPVSNTDIFNAVRAKMSPEFRDRIPAGTIENMMEVGTMITSKEYDTQFNAWLGELANLLVEQRFYNKVLENPLQHLIKEGFSWGDAIETIFVGLRKGTKMDYGKDGQSIDPFVKMNPDVHAEYHRVNEPIQYGVSVEKDRIRRAFYSAGGLQRLVDYIVGSLVSSANIDTWTLTKTEMASYINDTKATCPLLSTQKITTTDITDKTSAEDFILQVKNTLSAMKFPNNTFNPQQYYKTLSKRDVTLFIKSDILNTIGVKAMANVFNPENLNMNIRFEEMDDFGIDVNGKGTDDVQAVLAEDGWLLITSQFDETEDIYNPRGRYRNFFKTRQCSFGTTYMTDAVIFRKNW